MYFEHYGMTLAPFLLTPDARFWFESGTHRKAMAYLGYGLAQGEGFVVVTGDIGAGKTTLVGHLMEELDPAQVKAIALVSTQVEGDDMVRLVAQELGIATEGAAKAQLLDRIERALHDQGRARLQTLLIVDEAQNLPVSALEELRMLSNFTRGGGALLQILLLGQPEFRDRLASASGLEQLRQRVIAAHHLGPMEADETRGYVAHRLRVAGWTGAPGVGDDALAALHAASGGVPRKINLLMTRALMTAALDDAATIDGDTIERVVADHAAERPPTADAAVHPADPAYAARLDALEARIEAQETALRRVLEVMIDYVERDAGRARHARTG